LQAAAPHFPQRTPAILTLLTRQIAEEVNERRRSRESRNKVVLIQGRLQVEHRCLPSPPAPPPASPAPPSPFFWVILFTLKLLQGMPSNHTLVIPGRCYLNHRVFVQQQGARGSRTLFLFNDGNHDFDDGTCDAATAFVLLVPPINMSYNTMSVTIINSSRAFPTHDLLGVLVAKNLPPMAGGHEVWKFKDWLPLRMLDPASPPALFNRSDGKPAFALDVMVFYGGGVDVADFLHALAQALADIPCETAALSHLSPSSPRSQTVSMSPAQEQSRSSSSAPEPLQVASASAPVVSATCVFDEAASPRSVSQLPMAVALIKPLMFCSVAQLSTPQQASTCYSQCHPDVCSSSVASGWRALICQ
jgi:hypothetical protein